MNRLSWSAFLAVAFVGCSSGNAGDGGEVCVPGQSVACVGLGACPGGQICNADGQSYGPCECAQGSSSGGSSGGISSGGSSSGSGSGSTGGSSGTESTTGTSSSSTNGSSTGGVSSGASSSGGSSSVGGTTGGTSSGSGSGSGTTGGTSSGSGSGTSSSSSGAASGTIDVTLVSVGVHPAAAAALAALGLTPPALAGSYSVSLQAVSHSQGSPKTTTVGTVALTAANASGPITFSNVNVSGGAAALGLISAIAPTVAGGSLPAFPTCADVNGTSSTGFTDFYVAAGNQVYFGTPTANVTNGVAFALPASYVTVLDCAAGLLPGSASDLLNAGFALLYASGSAAAAGNPLSGVTFSSGSGGLLYYPAGYAAGSATATAPTSANGVATVTGVPGLATVAASDPAAGQFASRDLSTPAGSAYLVFYAP